MVVAQRLLMGGGGPFTPPVAQDLVGLINGTPDTNFVYAIGPVTSSDAGDTATVGASAVIEKGAAGQWDDGYVKDPALVWDGTQFVCYYAGWDGANFRIGRATSTTIAGTWTKYASNPVIGFGAGGAFDEDGAEFPVVLYEPDESPPWKMWYTGYPNGATPGSPTGLTIGYADSSDGLTWTKRGKVVDVGTAGAFNDVGMLSGAVYRSGSTYYLFFTGYRSDFLMHTGWVTATNPANSATYSAATAMTGYTSNISAGGVTWQSNLPRSIISQGSGFRVFGTLWNPTPADTEEISWMVEASSLTSWPAPSALWFSLAGWYLNSGENPSMIVG